MTKFAAKTFGIIIIESLRKNDKKTGEILYNEVIKYKIFEEPVLTAFLYKVSTKQEFYRILIDTALKVEKESFFPILHLEMHGDTLGLQFESGEYSAWEEIMPYFRTINVLIKNYLIIMLASCESNMIYGHLDPTKRAPFRIVIGALKKVGEKDILKCFETFYNNYFFKMDPFESVHLMNQEISKEYNTFVTMTSEKFFDKMLDPNHDPEHFEKLIENQSYYNKTTDKYFINLPFDVVKKITKERIVNGFAELRTYRDYFTMKDLKDDKTV
jgi:hypothetical protein